LPAGSFPEFKKELVRISFSGKTDYRTAHKKTIEGKGVSPERQRRANEEKGQEPLQPIPDKENRISIRILLIEE
jgi:hypothetical protein